MLSKVLTSKSQLANRFLKRSFLTAVFLLVSVALTNLLVNPYRVFFPLSENTKFAVKPRPQHMQHELKVMLGKQAKADILLLGNSRMEIGVNPQDLEGLLPNKSTFNLAVAGAKLSESASPLEVLIKNHKPSHVVIGADFYEYIVRGPASGQLQLQFVQDDWTFSLKVYAKSLFTFDALSDSIKTLAMPFRPYARSLTFSGHNPMNDFERQAQISGYRVLFDTGDVDHKLAFGGASKVIGLMRRDGSATMNTIEELLRYLEREGIKVTVVTYPVHMEFANLIWSNKIWNEYEFWKENLLKLTSNIGNVPLIDFGCLDPILYERVPLAGDRTSTMTGYWDSGHFKSNVGKSMMKTVFKSDANPLDSSAQLRGQLLTQNNISETHLACREAMANFLKTKGQ